MVQRLGSLVLATLALTAMAQRPAARSLTVAAASDLQGVLPLLAAQYERESGDSVRLVFGSSGNFFAQIKNGAPFDLFMSADIDYPRQLERSGLAEAGTLYEYATGRIVLWTLKSNAAAIGTGLQGLLAPGVRRIAIANPQHAPYGRAAVSVLQGAGIYDRVQPKLVFGENISQAAQFVQSGNADVGIVAQSIALLPSLLDVGASVEISRSSYPAITQAAVVVKASKNSAAARRFLSLLKTPAVATTLQRFGFDVPVASTVP